MTNAIPFNEWLNAQGDNVRLAMCDGHPETLILVDTTTMYVYKYVPAENQDDARDMIREFLRKIGPSNAAREFAQHEVQSILDKPLDFKVTKTSELKAKNAELQELILDVATKLGKNINLYELYEENTDLRAKNIKLRKLLLDIWNDAIQFDCFWDYVMDDGELYNEDELPHYQERMRELGIEVTAENGDGI